MSLLSDASSTLLGAASIVLGDAAGEALTLTAAAFGPKEDDNPESEDSSDAIELTGQLLPFLEGLLPGIVDSLASSSDESDDVEASSLDLAGSLRSLVGEKTLQIVVPQGNKRLDALDPSTTILQHIVDGGSVTDLMSQFSSAELADLVKTGSGPMLATVLAVEAGVEQILEKLRQIEGKVDDILRGMERERTAKMRGTITYLTDIVGTIRQGDLNPEAVTAFSGELENTDRQARGFTEEYHVMLTERVTELEELDIAGANLDIDDDVTAIHASVEKVAMATRGLLLSLSVRMLTMRVRTLLPIEQTSTEQRIARIYDEVDKIAKLVDRAESAMKRKADDVHGIRQEVVQKTGAILGVAGSLATKAIGGRLGKGLKGTARFAKGAIDKVGATLEGTAGVEAAQKVLYEEFEGLDQEFQDTIKSIRTDGDVITQVSEKSKSRENDMVLGISVRDDGKVWVEGIGG